MGRQGLGGAGSDLVHSVDPRTRNGLINALGMFISGKGPGGRPLTTAEMADTALMAHAGHGEIRPYNALGSTPEGFIVTPDWMRFGGGMSRDIGYPKSAHLSRFVSDPVNAAIKSQRPDIRGQAFEDIRQMRQKRSLQESLARVYGKKGRRN